MGVGDLGSSEGKGLWVFISGLFVQPLVVDGQAVKTGRSPGLKPAQILFPLTAWIAGQVRVPHTTRGKMVKTDMDKPRMKVPVFKMTV